MAVIRRVPPPSRPMKARMSVDAVLLEAWSEGLQVGALVILMLIVICNLRRHVLLHKLILLEQFLAVCQGVVIFAPDPIFGWYCSATILLLYVSYFLHNFISWIKIRPFLDRTGSLIFLGSLLLAQPYWVVALWTNFELFNGSGDEVYRKIRPLETFARDPWWIFTTCYLFWVLKTRFDRGVFQLIFSSPRFGVMIFCMLVSITFLIADVTSVFVSLHHANGGNPYWRLALIFKCASDTIFLDDFKRVFEVLGVNAIHQRGSHAALSSDLQSSSSKPSECGTGPRTPTVAPFRPSMNPVRRTQDSDDETIINDKDMPSPFSFSHPANGRRASKWSQATGEADLAISSAP